MPAQIRPVPRIPTDAEYGELAQMFMNERNGQYEGQSRQEIIDTLEGNAYISVFDNYVSGGPGYVGQVITIIWDGSPNIVTVVTRSASGLTPYSGELLP